MLLTTNRLIIRPWQPMADAQHAWDIYGDPQVTRWLQAPPDQSIQVTQARLQRYCERSVNGLGVWAVIDQAIGRAIGSLLLVPLPNSDKTNSDKTNNDKTNNDKIEIGWHFRPASWGYGYATEAAHAILHYGFKDLGLSTIHAVTSLDNVRSQRVMARLGMAPWGITTAYYNQPLRLYGLAAGNYSSGQLESMADRTASTSAPLT